jgi:hypothetical protein
MPLQRTPIQQQQQPPVLEDPTAEAAMSQTQRVRTALSSSSGIRLGNLRGLGEPGSPSAAAQRAAAEGQQQQWYPYSPDHDQQQQQQQQQQRGPMGDEEGGDDIAYLLRMMRVMQARIDTLQNQRALDEAPTNEGGDEGDEEGEAGSYRDVMSPPKGRRTAPPLQAVGPPVRRKATEGDRRTEHTPPRSRHGGREEGRGHDRGASQSRGRAHINRETDRGRASRRRGGNGGGGGGGDGPPSGDDDSDGDSTPPASPANTARSSRTNLLVDDMGPLFKEFGISSRSYAYANDEEFKVLKTKTLAHCPKLWGAKGVHPNRQTQDLAVWLTETTSFLQAEGVTNRDNVMLFLPNICVQDSEAARLISTRRREGKCPTNFRDFMRMLFEHFQPPTAFGDTLSAWRTRQMDARSEHWRDFQTSHDSNLAQVHLMYTIAKAQATQRGAKMPDLITCIHLQSFTDALPEDARLHLKANTPLELQFDRDHINTLLESFERSKGRALPPAATPTPYDMQQQLQQGLAGWMLGQQPPLFPTTPAITQSERLA